MESAPFEYCTVVLPGVLDRLRLEAVFADLPETVYRAKGYVHFPTGPHLVDFVAGNFSYEPVQHVGENELVFIGSADRRPQEMRQSERDRLRGVEKRPTGNPLKEHAISLRELWPPKP